MLAMETKPSVVAHTSNLVVLRSEGGVRGHPGLHDKFETCLSYLRKYRSLWTPWQILGQPGLYGEFQCELFIMAPMEEPTIVSKYWGAQGIPGCGCFLIS